ncbi:MAG: sugar ABC transporter substrate-binding protein [Saprospiraceae bacterium]|nr:MAG: sugar ABC transporter substrate-binding protein [Saprospiraceae bacterium]
MVKNYWIIILFLFSLSCDHQAPDRKDLLFWSSNNRTEIDFVSSFTEKWNGQYPDRPVRFQPVPEGQSSEEVILAAVVGKTTPDIYANMWQGSVEMYAKAGVLIPLDTLEGFTEFILQRCGQETVEEITSADGHIYQVPWKINPIMTIYNKSLLAKLDTTKPPSTYSEYLKAGELVKEDSDHDGYIDQWIGYTEVKVIWYQRFFNFYPLYLAASHGGSLVKDNKAAFNNEHAVNVFRFLQDLYNNNYFSREQLSAGQDRFITENIMTKWTGPWEISYVEKYKKRTDFDFDFYPMQVPDNHTGPIYTYADPKNIVIFNTCQNPQGAWDFIKTLIDREGDKAFLEITGQLPRRQNLESDSLFIPFFVQNPKVLTFAQQANYVKGIDNCEVIVEVFDIISQEYEACVIYNKKTPEKAIQDAARAVNVLLGNQ